MKKSCILIIAVMVIMITACGSSETEVEMTQEEITIEESVQEENVIESEEADQEAVDGEVEQGDDGIDVDLTTLSATMVYAEVYNMYVNPEDYMGKIVKMEGSFSVLDVPMAGMIYFSVIIEDALGCCAQGIEFELEGDYSYPSDYPEVGDIVTVVGEFDIYYEDEYMYCRLINAAFQ